ncbi:phosphopantetheine-binding protein [Solibacillus sp. FSL W8-0474]|uniref:acyl carrier protein n=1 Tax=Solibacillus sp. FSL W8-0474 TaxID=2975336 RepID=UPI0030F7EE26
MNLKQFTALCEEILELEEGALKMETRLESIEEWDSLTRMDLISYCDEKFDTTLPIEIFQDSETFQDVVAKLERYLQVEII